MNRVAVVACLLVAVLIAACSAAVPEQLISGRVNVKPKDGLEVSSAMHDDDDDEIEAQGAKRRFDFTNVDKHYVHTIIEGETAAFVKEYDMVAILVVHPTACYMCETAFVQFKQMAEEFYTDSTRSSARLLGGKTTTKTVKFGLLNTEYEMEELEEILKMENINPERLPLLLVLKQEFVNVLERPPISFTINDLMSRRFPRFLLRLAGNSPQAVTAESELVTRIAHSATQRISIGIWANDVPAALHPLIIDARFDVLLHVFPSAKDANPELVAMYNPDGADLVVYHYTGPLDATSLTGEERAKYVKMIPYHFNRNITDYHKHAEHQAKMFQAVLFKWRNVRPGHELDFIKKITVVDGDVKEADCRRTQLGDRVHLKIYGRATLTGTLFDTKEEAFEVGAVVPSVPAYVTTKGLVGICAGQRRRIGFPAGKAFPDENVRPQAVREDDGVTYFIEMVKFLDEKEIVKTSAVDSLNPDPNTEL
jgi:hypothetical protein